MKGSSFHLHASCSSSWLFFHSGVSFLFTVLEGFWKSRRRLEHPPLKIIPHNPFSTSFDSNSIFLRSVQVMQLAPVS
ncbi:hypothetical protein BO71DRAFT_65688 [Aspergillus ellipticus CBS 707.79]|uniref:Uncharacterized protein n=1 Tax=Aspergillus ellipticus CBS 707.79 TaxID=1448320 RepID=A0A319DL89_9EURO|nr:hypothetical protein BO71DRAFT_65688 [Aspergillus ellipticus CBS 707.79]